MALLSSPHLADLAVLDLRQNHVRGLNRKALAKLLPGGLRAVVFYSNPLTAADVGALAESPRFSNLVSLDLDFNNLTDLAVTRLTRGFGDHAPAILSLVGNRLGPAAIRELAAWEGASRIQMLDLTYNDIDTPAAKRLANSPYLDELRHLEVARDVPDAGLTALRKRFGKKLQVNV
jgi:hypothetical protein